MHIERVVDYKSATETHYNFCYYLWAQKR